MRAGLSTIQQTLTTEAAAVLNQSIAEAGRRNHGQTTPLHVAAALLSSPSGYLRQACIRSHPNSSHPLQCRALELCFSVALERLPSAQSTAEPELEPPISNALMAALRRAQAHQRRGCPEQQQQPLLAVKVELDQLIISILDDPGVSRVMKEAGFSSPAVKAAIEQSLTSPSSNAHHHLHYHLQNRNPYYLNPRLQQQQRGPNANIGNQRGDDEINKLLEIMLRGKKRNPILVGDFLEPEGVVKELLKKIENREFGNDGVFENARVISMDKNCAPSKIKELGDVIENLIGIGGEVILDLGDLKWLVEQQGITEHGRAAVAEMAELLARFGGDEDNNHHKVWLIGTATCETYLRCQVYYSTMESDWDLQAVPMASRSRFPGMFPRLGTERFSSNPVELLNPVKAVQTPLPALTRCAFENINPSQRTTLCPQCSEDYEKELAKLEAIKNSFSGAKQVATQPSLPQWLQNAKINAKRADKSQETDCGLISEQKTQELQKKWRDMCFHLHPNFHQTSRADRLSLPTLSMTSLYDPNLLARPIFQPKLPTPNPLKESLQLNTNKVKSQPTNSPPESPVRTDLVLGRKVTDEKFTDDQAKDFLGCISSEPQTKLLDKFANTLDTDTYKKLVKRLMEKAWWQAEAAMAVASAVTRSRLGGGKRRGSAAGLRGDIWLLFAGPDRLGKKKMASVLAEQICGATSLITICLGARRDDDEGSNVNVRGKTAIDRIAEVVRRNPFSVIMLDGVDEAGVLVRGNIKRAIERGRLTDSYGREVSIGNAVFVLTGDWSTNSREVSRDGRFASGSNWQLGLIVREKSAKRRASWSQDEDDRPLKPRIEEGPSLSFDLNLAVGPENKCDKTDGSHNSSDVTVDHEEELSIANQNFSITSVPHDLLDSVDDSIVFKPFDSALVLREIKKMISVKFSVIVDDEDSSLEVEDDVLEKILGGLLHDRTSLEEWIEKVLAPCFDRIKPRIPSDERSSTVVRLVVESDFESSKGSGDWLPSRILV